MDHGPGTREVFHQHAAVAGGGADEAEEEAAHDLRSGNLEARFRVAGLMVHATAVAPERCRRGMKH